MRKQVSQSKKQAWPQHLHRQWALRYCRGWVRAMLLHFVPLSTWVQFFQCCLVDKRTLTRGPQGGKPTEDSMLGCAEQRCCQQETAINCSQVMLDAFASWKDLYLSISYIPTWTSSLLDHMGAHEPCSVVMTGKIKLLPREVARRPSSAYLLWCNCGTSNLSFDTAIWSLCWSRQNIQTAT